MLAAETSSSGPGNGDHQWLLDLIEKISNLTSQLGELTGNIELDANPAEDDVASACNLVTQLLALIKKQILPHQAKFKKPSPESGTAPSLDKELRSLYQAGQNALKAVAVYQSTLSREHRHRDNDRRSHARYAADGESLQDLRYGAAVKINELLGASEGFLRFISP